MISPKEKAIEHLGIASTFSRSRAIEAIDIAIQASKEEIREWLRLDRGVRYTRGAMQRFDKKFSGKEKEE